MQCVVSQVIWFFVISEYMNDNNRSALEKIFKLSIFYDCISIICFEFKLKTLNMFLNTIRALSCTVYKASSSILVANNLVRISSCWILFSDMFCTCLTERRYILFRNTEGIFTPVLRSLKNFQLKKMMNKFCLKIDQLSFQSKLVLNIWKAMVWNVLFV